MEIRQLKKKGGFLYVFVWCLCESSIDCVCDFWCVVVLCDICKLEMILCFEFTNVQFAPQTHAPTKKHAFNE